MLAVFEHAISRPPPEFDFNRGCEVPRTRPEMAALFAREYPGTSFYNFIGGNFMALSRETGNPAHDFPRSVVAMDNLFCVFIGSLENISELRRHYGLSRNTNEAMLVLEMYKVLRDRAPYPPDQVIKDLIGRFAFVLFDAGTGTLFIARDRDGGVPFFWGMALDLSLIFSDNSEIVLDICGQATTYFPPGCIYSSNGGLVSFVHPMHQVRPVVTMDDSGEPYSIFFQVDLLARMPSIPRVGSGTNWNSTMPNGHYPGSGSGFGAGPGTG